MHQIDFLGLLVALAAGMVLEAVDICLVRATDDAVRGRFAGLVSIAIVAFGATSFLVAGQQAGFIGPLPFPDFMASGALGGAIFAAGALCNGACAIGTIGRLARGDLSYMATLIGGGVMSAFVPRLVAMPATPTASMLVSLVWLAFVTAAVSAATVIGGRSLTPRQILLLILFGWLMGALGFGHGDWLWLDIVRQIGSGAMVTPLAAAGLATVIGGATLMAAWQGRLHWRRVGPVRVLREAAGGALMVLGAAVIPGGNDSLIALGVPSGNPHDIVATLAMVATLAVWFLLTGQAVPSEPLPLRTVRE